MHTNAWKHSDIEVCGCVWLCAVVCVMCAVVCSCVRYVCGCVRLCAVVCVMCAVVCVMCHEYLAY